MNFLKFFLLCLLIALNFSTLFGVPNQVKTNTDKLILLHVLFRHGDRTPQLNEMYPTDPHFNTTHFAEGLGELTKGGKRREYNIGDALRKRYDNYLGLYKSSEVSATSTDYIRTKMSCQLVLAGLYPPADSQIWKNGFNWQPIPYDYNQAGSDYLLGEPMTDCPKYIVQYKEYLASPQANLVIQKNKDLYEYLSLHTGRSIKSTRDAYNMQFVLIAEESLGLQLPDWTKSVWPENITAGAVDEYYGQLATPELQRKAGGFLLSKIINDTKFKIANSGADPKKIYLYSAHENNVAYQLINLNVFYPHVPPYGSYIVFEIHKINEVYGVKILYEDYSKPEPTYLKMPDCDVFCPFEKFTELMEKHLPQPEDTCT